MNSCRPLFRWSSHLITNWDRCKLKPWHWDNRDNQGRRGTTAGIDENRPPSARPPPDYSCNLGLFTPLQKLPMFLPSLFIRPQVVPCLGRYSHRGHLLLSHVHTTATFPVDKRYSTGRMTALILLHTISLVMSWQEVSKRCGSDSEWGSGVDTPVPLPWASLYSLNALPHVTISSTISLTIARWMLSLQRLS